MTKKNNLPFFVLLYAIFNTTTCIALTPARNEIHWHGVYAGANGGLAWGTLRNQLTIQNNPNSPLFYQPVLSGVNATGSQSYQAIRMTGGVQAGYDHTVKKRWILGLEVSYDFTDLEKSSNRRALYTNTSTTHVYSITSHSSTKQLATLRPRIGYEIGTYLPYLTAGGALTPLKYQQTFTDHQHGFSQSNTLNKTVFGWTVGGGLAYRPFENISFKAEYLYTNFGHQLIESNLIGQSTLTGLSASMSNTLTNVAIQTLLLGINVHFE